MFSQIKSRRGETIIEVLIAVLVLAVGIIAGVRLLISSGINNELSRERVVATNLAREGIEAVRNIRDTNWLRFAGERRRCWNNADFDSSITCEESGYVGVPIKVIEDQTFYIAKFNSTNFRWELNNSPSDALDLTDGIDTSDEDYRLQIDADGLYNHDLSGTDSIYFREIWIEYLNDSATAPTSETPPEKANVIRITSKVEWYDRGKFKNVVLTAILTDHLGRKNHN